jgi:H+/gluconate symporter-like permease
VIHDFSEIEKDVPHPLLAIAPLALVIATILAPRLLQMAGMGEGAGVLATLVTFATSQPVLWPSIALVVASLVAIALFPLVRANPLQTMGLGTQDAILPLMATSAVIGFGGVVAQTSGFATFTGAVIGSGLPPHLSMFAAASTVSGITGSSSGGLQIFMATMAEPYLALGIDPQELHRLVAMASGGLDSLPHCGAVIAMLTITQLTHKQAYKDVGVVTVIVPVVATLATTALAMAI